MAKKQKPPDRSQVRSPKYSCECECSNCDIGAHERCTSPKCHMPKWANVTDKRKSDKH
jgi:hypothetical protein